MSTASSTSRAPAWFVAHGGPPTLFATSHPAFKHWTRIGADMRAANLSGLVVISAHWQSDAQTRNPRAVQINVDENNAMLYDYYNFPDFFYKLRFHSTNPRAFSDLVSKTLRDQGFEVETTKRGIDHGVFIPLKAAFSDQLPADSPHAAQTGVPQDSGRDGMPDGVPLCQISLPSELVGSSRAQAEASLALGKALRALREHNIGLMLGGQPVHNLRAAMRYFRSGEPDPSTGLFPAEPFSSEFSRAISKAILEPGHGGEAARSKAVVDLVDHPAYKQAHPTDEHFLPLAVAAGASFGDESVKEDTAVPDGGMAWNMYRWG